MILRRIIFGMALIIMSVATSRGDPYALNPGDVLSISV
jgi:hypothetical protein